ncbi:DciA family protein [Dactylosporangium sp. NPDC051485]|uniref:DciA family protein n=1 Tax=Dactylosporangium sp. NPDC051485 TaxID=3154846 RepID=UPI003430ACB9
MSENVAKNSEKSGPELARAAVEAALAKHRSAPRRKSVIDSGGRRRGYTGPGPDPRDPQLFGTVLERLMKQRGWQRPTSEARIFGEWEKVVGADIAAHSRPVKLEDGDLTIEAESTAWATQLRMLAARLLAGIAREVGHNVVKRLHIHGPATPSWGSGPRRVRGRGPRDTYG